MSADEIPQALFSPRDSSTLPESLQFCADELRYGLPAFYEFVFADRALSVLTKP